jgi:hypothetical protein
MTDPFPNRIEGGTLRRWVLRAFMIGLAAGVMVAVVALVN